eukprot:5585360-Pleurochrysis_carterae.AAC.1
MADLLSRCSGVGVLGVLAEFVEKRAQVRGLLAASEAALISASQNESATEGCFLLLHVMAAR